MEAGRYEQAANVMRQLLAKHPDSVIARSRLGVALTRAGRYQLALDAFADSAGNGYYEVQGLPDHADALRGVGRCEEAAALRLEAVVSTEREELLVPLYVGAIDDRVACGDLAGAEDLAWEALAVDPQAPEIHAALADALRAAGDPEEADFHLLYAEWLDPDPLRVLVASARQAAEAGDWDAVAERLPRIEKARPRTPEAFVLRERLLVARGRRIEAGVTCTQPQWREHEDLTVRQACQAAMTGGGPGAPGAAGGFRPGGPAGLFPPKTGPNGGAPRGPNGGAPRGSKDRAGQPAGSSGRAGAPNDEGEGR